MDDFTQDKYEFEAKVWLYDGPTPWHFITLPKEISKEIDFFFGQNKRGWGSLPVKMTVGETTWETSIFPSKDADSYILPLKASVRKSESIQEGDVVEFKLKIKN